MPSMRYDICADEAWTHGSIPPNRYWCFYGGVFGSESDCDRLETALRAKAAAVGNNREIKWKSVTWVNIKAYKALIDVFCDHLLRYDLKYRQSFLDRSHVYMPEVGQPPLTPLDIQFRICYQFLKHHFGLRYLAAADPANDHNVTLRLDTHSSQTHKNVLTRFAVNIGQYLNQPRLKMKIQFVNSTQFLRLQLCDLLMGAAGSHGNKTHLRRAPGQRGMNSSQQCRLEMAGYIYDWFRKIDAQERGTKAFNWFESTGVNGDRENRFRHKLRIWKFVPKRYSIDEGWQNKNLTTQGLYVAPRIVQRVLVPEDPEDLEDPPPN